MQRNIVVFEDRGWRNLTPLTWTRPAASLRCGVFTLAEKIAQAYPDAQVWLHARPEVVVANDAPPGVRFGMPDTASLLINGRCVAGPWLHEAIPSIGEPVALRSGDVPVAARISAEQWTALSKVLADGAMPEGWADDLPTQDAPPAAELIAYPWDLIRLNAKEIAADAARLSRPAAGAIVHPSATLVNEGRIFLDNGVKVDPGAILIAEDGPIVVGPNVRIMAGAVIEGPAAIGPNSTVKILAKIYEGVSTGPFCKIGGEIEECIFQGYSSKQHDGFLGHSVLGEWVNLGADTNNSDLKNNYGPVRVTIDGREIDSGQRFVGCTIGDHSKTGINTMINTGTVIGMGSNVFGAGYPPKSIPSFAWGGEPPFVEHKLDKFLATAEVVMGRRHRELTEGHKTLYRYVFEATAHERSA